MRQRRGFTQHQSLEERLADEAKRLREQADLLPRGLLRDEVLRKARQAETGSNVSEWLRSPGSFSEFDTGNVRAMPRYYFDLLDGEALVKDEEGVELPDIGSARVEAGGFLADMVKDIITRDPNALGFPMSVEVRDSEGSLFLLSLTFSNRRRD